MTTAAQKAEKTKKRAAAKKAKANAKKSPATKDAKTTKQVLEEAEAKHKANMQKLKEKAFEEGYKKGIDVSKISVEEAEKPASSIDEVKPQPVVEAKPEPTPEPAKVIDSKTTDAPVASTTSQKENKTMPRTTYESILFYVKKIGKYVGNLGMAIIAGAALFTLELPLFLFFLILMVCVGVGSVVLADGLEDIRGWIASRPEAKKEETPKVDEKKAA